MSRAGKLRTKDNEPLQHNLKAVMYSEVVSYMNTKQYKKDKESLKFQDPMLSLVPECKPAMLTYQANSDPKVEEYKPLMTGGDGNCGLRAICMLQFGTQERFMEMR